MSRPSHPLVALLSLATILLGPVSPAAEKIDVYERPQRAERSRSFDARHYRIDLRFDEDTRSFWGKTSLTFSPLRDGLASLALDADTFVVKAVENGAGRPLRFDQANGKLTIFLTEALDHGEEGTVTVSYAARNVKVDGGDYGLQPGSALGLTFQEATADHPRVIAVRSWPEGARHWFPAYDHPNDRATQEVFATVRDDYRVLSNGRLVSVTEGPEPGTKTWHWSQERPHPTYLFTLVAGPYVVLKDSLGELPIGYWVFADDVDAAERSFHKTPEMLAFFNDAFGHPYPWVKYDQVVVPGMSGGMENTSATVLGLATLHDERAEQDFPSHGLVAHELAHMWWGDLVSYRAWSETWMSESFATYGEYLFSRHDLGEDEGALNLLEKKESYLREARTEYMRPIVFQRWEFPSDNFDRHTYPKGAAVLHMLRWILGDEPFRRTLSHFLTEHAFQPVDTHDFQVAIKEATGQNLDWFFEQWVFKPGHPVFDVSYVWDQVLGRLRLTVRQTQDTSRGVPVYQTPVVFGIHTSRGRSSERLWLRSAEEVFELELEDRPLLVRFDEGNYLLKEWTFEKSLEELVYQLRHDDAIGRRWAAGELARFQSAPEAVSALLAAAEEDPFWGVRQAAVETIGSFAGRSQGAFLQKAATDPSSKVRVAALQALGSIGEPSLVGFYRKRFERDDSYLAQAEILRAMGRTGDASVRKDLEAAAERRSPHDVLREAAEAALGDLASDPSLGEDVAAVAQRYIARWKDFYPTSALAAGDESSAVAFEDFSHERVTAWIAVNRRTLQRLGELQPISDFDERVDRRVLTRQVRLELQRWEADDAARTSPALYADAVSQALTHLLARDALDPKGQLQAVESRLRGVTALAETARRQLRSGGTAAVERSAEVAVRTADFFRSRLPGVAEAWLEPEDRAAFEALCVSAAEAVTKLASHLRVDVETVSDVMGEREYARRLATYADWSLGPERLAALALEEIAEVRAQIVERATSYWQTAHPDAPLASPEERVAAAIEEMESHRVDGQVPFRDLFVRLTEQAEQFVRDEELASVPDETTLVVDLSPPHFAGAAVGGVYPAGPFDPEADTLFYLPSVPDEAPDAQREGFYRSFNDHFNAMIVPHEMFPGHYLQLKVASRSPHFVRSLFDSPLYTEGWATLCERLALEAGWDDQDPLTWLAHLRKRLENATRAYVSVQVHCRGWDRQRLEEFAVREGLLAPQFAVNLWHRVIASPLQLTSYFLGNRAFVALYEAERKRQGETFRLRDFSDRILETGSIPLGELHALFAEARP